MTNNIKEVLKTLEIPGDTSSKKIRLVGGHLISSPDLELIKTALEKHSFVKSLELALVTLRDDGVQSLVQNLSEYSLVYLQLAHVGMTEKGAIALAARIQESKLRKLDITFNQIGPGGANAIANALMDCLLEILLIGRCNIGEVGGRAFATVFASEKGTNLRSLDLRLNNLGSSTIDIVRALPNTKIEGIRLDSNDVSLETIQELCRVLEFTKLQELFLGSNNLPDDALIALASVLNRTKLRTLCLGGNLFTDHGLSFLAAALRENLLIENIDLKSHIGITDEGCENIRESIKTHRNLRRCLFRGGGEEALTSVTAEAQEKLDKQIVALHTNRAKIMTVLLHNKSKFGDDFLDPYFQLVDNGIQVLSFELLREMSEFL